MLNTLLGWILIIAGVFFLLKPEALRKRLQKKGIKNMKKVLFLITIFIAVLLISAAWKHEGALSKIIVIVGIVGVLKAFFLLKAKASDKIIEWTSNQPVKFFRIGAFFPIILGIGLLMLR